MLRRVHMAGWLGVLLSLCTTASYAQTSASKAKQYYTSGDYDKAADAFGELYGLNPDSVYADYLNTLLISRKYKQAEQLVEKQGSLRFNPLLAIDLGIVFYQEGKYEKAYAQFNSVLQRINGDLIFTEQMASAFTRAGLEDYAMLAYDKTSQMLRAPWLCSGQLARLYTKCGELDKAIDVMLVPIPNQGLNLENVKALMLELLGNDEAKLAQMQKALVKKINQHPDNAYYVELLTWIFTQKNDWDGALIQMEAIDERNNEAGARLFNLARLAADAKQYETSIKAYDDIIAKGNEKPYYIMAKSERLGVSLRQLKANHAYTRKDVDSVTRLYEAFLADYPKHYAMQEGADLALVLAQYGNNVPRAIEVLKRGIADPDIQRNMSGQFKLQMGDYYVLIGQVWEASLTYSQVDKEFKQDAMGEDARFRNAKLAYYRGDFDWAQHQLTILKSATSELISNDAIYLSVLITENVEDSNLVPLQRFAYAGLLVFQNKDKEAEALLDSINTAFPKHPLNDDIIMVRADMARKRHDYEKAITYLKEIIAKYGQDVLGDDATFKIAEIYQTELHNNEQAKHYYEQLIIDYQGSTFVQSARQRLNDINNGNLP